MYTYGVEAECQCPFKTANTNIYMYTYGVEAECQCPFKTANTNIYMYYAK